MKEQKTKTNFPTCQVKFVGWKKAPQNWDWESWVQNLSSVHQSTWKNAGIYEAIMSSTYEITRHDDLILELASRWCSDTNSFVFGWGEATLTLEDMLVLGGYSAVGVSVLSPVENDAKLVKIEAQLEQKRLELGRSTTASTALQNRWLDKFKGKGSDLEHAAFLSLWLSRFVFPKGAKTKINKDVFPVAARLSIGVKVALGPAVLAMLYKDLSFLRRTQHFTQLMYQSGDRVGHVELCALFHLVQIWAWERFPVLKSVPNCAFACENFPRLARWSNVKIWKDTDLKLVLDSANKDFLWCPYGSSPGHKERDSESCGQCVKTSELRGFDSCAVSYQPQRVLKQFGLDQNILSDKVDKSIDVTSFLNLKPLQPTMKQQTQAKVEDTTECSPPAGSPIQIEVIDLVDSDSDLDFGFDEDDILMETDVSTDDICSVEKTAESETAEKKQTPPLTSVQIKEFDQDFVPFGKDGGGQVQPQHLNLNSPSSNHESNEVADFVNRSEHETGQFNGEAVVTNDDETEGMSTSYLDNGSGMSCNAESYTSWNSENFDLEARIRRLEEIVYARR